MKVMILGAGKMGLVVAKLLSSDPRYKVLLVDQFSDAPVSVQQHSRIQYKKSDINDMQRLATFLQEFKPRALVSCLPYFLNIQVATLAKDNDVHYFDLTEDVKVTEKIAHIAKGASQAFVPQCGVAPGFVNIVAHDMAKSYSEIDNITMRVGALPIASSNILKYALTWSAAGLVNQYANLCPAIQDGQPTMLQPLEGLHSVSIEGDMYECFNTSGGVGSMVSSYIGKAKNVCYQTIRYPGHCAIIKLLMQDFAMREHQKAMCAMIERSFPATTDDFVVLFVTVNGIKSGQYREEIYVKKIYNQMIADEHFTAIQIITAGSLVVVIDTVLANPEKYKGLVKQEDFPLAKVLTNPFSQYFRS
jgi:saccharopine dehydrogenase-like NADP-dependent oxidoreductase